MDTRLALVEQQLAGLRVDVAKLQASCATKEDLAKDLANCATKEDLAKLRGEVAALDAKCATKSDLTQVYVAINAQTTRLFYGLTSVIGLTSAAVYFIARNVH